MSLRWFLVSVDLFKQGRIVRRCIISYDPQNTLKLIKLNWNTIDDWSGTRQILEFAHLPGVANGFRRSGSSARLRIRLEGAQDVLG